MIDDSSSINDESSRIPNIIDLEQHRLSESSSEEDNVSIDFEGNSLGHPMSYRGKEANERLISEDSDEHRMNLTQKDRIRYTTSSVTSRSQRSSSSDRVVQLESNNYAIMSTLYTRADGRQIKKNLKL